MREFGNKGDVLKMKISGFTFIRNGNKFDFPYIESIKSILPLVDELVIAVGDSEDGRKEKGNDVGDRGERKERVGEEEEEDGEEEEEEGEEEEEDGEEEEGE